MTFEEAFYSYLSDQTTRPGYPVVFPDDVEFPAWRYQRITGLPLVTHDGDSGAEQLRLQVSCYGKTYADAKTLTAEVKAAISGYRGPVGDFDATLLVMNETDLYEAEARLHHIAIDVDVLATS